MAANKELFTHQEGKLKLLGIYGRLVTVLSSIVLERLFEDNFGKKKADDLLYLVSEAQSYNATKWLVEKVGIPLRGNELRIFKEIASQGQVTGYGVTEVIKFNLKKKMIIVSLRNNVFPLEYRALFGKQKSAVDHYARGLIGGVCKYIFGEEIVTISEQCPATGKKKALYRIVPLEGAVEKYGDLAKKFIPDPSINRQVLDKVSVRKLVA
ncbi:hypothetical protein JXB11_02800 [Candidatus Woesearchaeota archaeon]|nr:hypothetical protein [Candidatus Woesearchaeota archaeon]